VLRSLRRRHDDPRLALALLLPRVSAGLTLSLTLLTVLGVLVGMLFTLASGALVGSVPAAVSGGFSSPAGERLIAALVAVVALFVLRQSLDPLEDLLTTTLGRQVEGNLQLRAMRAALGPAGIAHLEDPAVVDLLSRARGVATGRYTPSQAVRGLFNLLLKLAQTVVSTALIWRYERWWLALGLMAVLVVTRTIARRNVLQEVAVATGATPVHRRTEYFLGLALEPGAAKETRVFGLEQWIVGRFRAHWLEAMQQVWTERARSARTLAPWVIAVVFACVLAAIGLTGRDAATGRIGLAALTIAAQSIVTLAAYLFSINLPELWLEHGATAVPAVLELEGTSPPAPARRGRLFVIREDDADGKSRAYSNTPLPVSASSGRGVLLYAPVTAPAQSRPGPTASFADEGRGVRSPPAIRFENVNFCYPGSDCNVFSGLDLIIPAGRSLAIVGANGAGKTTLIKLLCRLYDTTAGRIVADGVDLREVDAARWRQHVAVIFQDFLRYKLTAAENVGFGAPALAGDRAALERAANRAGADEIIAALPHGWDTVLSREYERGADLSGGQWQRIALARALFAVEAGAGVLVLDEPTANLDVRAEAELFDRFLELTAGLTTILISHRFPSVRRADAICVLEDGRVAERGTHEELLAAGGRYARLFRLQAARFTDTPPDAVEEEADRAADAKPGAARASEDGSGETTGG